MTPLNHLIQEKNSRKVVRGDMKSNFKKIIPLVIILIMLISFYGCTSPSASSLVTEYNGGEDASLSWCTGIITSIDEANYVFDLKVDPETPPTEGYSSLICSTKNTASGRYRLTNFKIGQTVTVEFIGRVKDGTINVYRFVDSLPEFAPKPNIK